MHICTFPWYISFPTECTFDRIHNTRNVSFFTSSPLLFDFISLSLGESFLPLIWLKMLRFQGECVRSMGREQPFCPGCVGCGKVVFLPKMLAALKRNLAIHILCWITCLSVHKASISKLKNNYNRQNKSAGLNSKQSTWNSSCHVNQSNDFDKSRDTSLS